jgi:hypothetical protein
MFVKMDTSTLLISLVVVIILLTIVYFLFIKKDTQYIDIRVEEGKFSYFNQNEWKNPPLTPIGDNTLLGSFIFNDERKIKQDEDSIANLYCTRRINAKQALVIRGTASKVLNYWSYGLFKLDPSNLVPVGHTLNNRMVKDSRNGDDIVVIVSPNYKFAQYVANKIVKEEYSKKSSDDKHVIFRYFPMPKFDASLRYTVLFEAYKSNAGADPKIKAYRYTFTRDEDFPYFPVEDIPLKDRRENTLDENKFIIPYNNQIKRQISKYTEMKSNTIVDNISNDYIITQSTFTNIKKDDKFIIAVMDHSSTGKCLYSEILAVDPKTNTVYKSYKVSEYDPITANPDQPLINYYVFDVEKDVDSLKIVEKIVIDMSTDVRPNPETIIPARVFKMN